jgi:hypothetical protein
MDRTGNSDCTAAAKVILSEGKSFVGRYYANSGRKRLGLPEAKVLGSVGLHIVALWEDKSPTNSAYFSYTKGVDDSTSAYHVQGNYETGNQAFSVHLRFLTIRREFLRQRGTATGRATSCSFAPRRLVRVSWKGNRRNYKEANSFTV